MAELDGKTVGHILYTKSKILRDDWSEIDTITFGLLSVLPKYHKQGIGSALVLHSLDETQESDFGAVLIVDVPDYYPKLGFKCAGEYGLVLEYGSTPDAFMAYELLPPEFEACEKDDAGFVEFHNQFTGKNYN